MLDGWKLYHDRSWTSLKKSCSTPLLPPTNTNMDYCMCRWWLVPHLTTPYYSSYQYCAPTRPSMRVWINNSPIFSGGAVLLVLLTSFHRVWWVDPIPDTLGSQPSQCLCNRPTAGKSWWLFVVPLKGRKVSNVYKWAGVNASIWKHINSSCGKLTALLQYSLL